MSGHLWECVIINVQICSLFAEYEPYLCWGGVKLTSLPPLNPMFDVQI